MRTNAATSPPINVRFRSALISVSLVCVRGVAAPSSSKGHTTFKTSTASTRFGRYEPPKRGISRSQPRSDAAAVPENSDKAVVLEPERPANAPGLARLHEDAVLIGDTAGFITEVSATFCGLPAIGEAN